VLNGIGFFLVVGMAIDFSRSWMFRCGDESYQNTLSSISLSKVITLSIFYLQKMLPSSSSSSSGSGSGSGHRRTHSASTSFQFSRFSIFKNIFGQEQKKELQFTNLGKINKAACSAESTVISCNQDFFALPFGTYGGIIGKFDDGW